MTIDRETEARLLAEIDGAWQALPDDATGDHDTLADAIRALAADRGQWQTLAGTQVDDLRHAWGHIPDDLARECSTLEEAVGATCDRFAISGHRDGWRKALETVSELMAEQCDATPEFQVAYVVGLLSGLLAVDRG
jgi:hypothetical protein